MNKSTVIRISSILLLILFFIPYFSVSCSGKTISFSGADMTFGKDINAQHIAGNFLMILLLLLPAAVLFVSFYKKIAQYESTTAIVSSVLYIFIIYVAKSYVTEQAAAYNCTPRTEGGFYITLLINLGVIGFFIYDRFKGNLRVTLSPQTRE